MKFILTMIMCTSVYNTCLEPFPMPTLYNTHYECMIAGYNEAIDKAKEIREFEDMSRKHLAQLRMARWSLIGMGVFTAMLFMPFIPDDRIELLTDVSDLFYITGAGLVGAYMGVSAWMSKNRNGK